MPKKLMLILSLVSVGLGAIILVISLLLASPAYQVTEGGKVARTFYVGEEICPDHLFYPFLNMEDWLALRLAKDQDKKAIEMSIAQKRLTAAQRMMERNPQAEELTVSVLEKSHIYLAESLSELDQTGRRMIPAQVIYIAQVMNQRRQEMQAIGAEMSDSSRAKVDQLIQAEDVLRQKFWSKYEATFRKAELEAVRKIEAEGGAKNEMSILRQQSN